MSEATCTPRQEISASRGASHEDEDVFDSVAALDHDTHGTVYASSTFRGSVLPKGCGLASRTKYARTTCRENEEDDAFESALASDEKASRHLSIVQFARKKRLHRARRAYGMLDGPSKPASNGARSSHETAREGHNADEMIEQANEQDHTRTSDAKTSSIQRGVLTSARRLCMVFMCVFMTLILVGTLAVSMQARMASMFDKLPSPPSQPMPWPLAPPLSPSPSPSKPLPPTCPPPPLPRSPRPANPPPLQPPLSPPPIAPPPSQPPLHPPYGNVYAINARFLEANAEPTRASNISTAGVLVTSFDWTTNPNLNEPWWTGGDRVSSTLIRPGFTHVWSERGQGGFVIHPIVASRLLRCAYKRDGHSVNTRSGCEPWCDSGLQYFFGCAYSPAQFGEMLRAQEECCSRDAAHPQEFVPYIGDMQKRYNEIVLDAATWQRLLPSSIEAVFMHAATSDEKKAHARDVHASFVRNYRLHGDAVPPLLVYDGQRVPPFSEYVGHARG